MKVTGVEGMVFFVGPVQVIKPNFVVNRFRRESYMLKGIWDVNGGKDW